MARRNGSPVSISTRPWTSELGSSIRDGLLAFCCNAGLAVVAEMMQAELTELIGEKGHHDGKRIASRNGSASGSVILGGRRVPIARPRAVRKAGGELTLDSYTVSRAH